MTLTPNGYKARVIVRSEAIRVFMGEGDPIRFCGLVGKVVVASNNGVVRIAQHIISRQHTRKMGALDGFVVWIYTIVHDEQHGISRQHPNTDRGAETAAGTATPHVASLPSWAG